MCKKAAFIGMTYVAINYSALSRLSCILIIGALVVAVRSCLHRESRFVVKRWNK